MPRDLVKAARVGPVASPATAAGDAARPASSILRPLVLAGIPLVGVALAILVARPADTGPAVITANPLTWRCDEGSPTWSAPIRAAGDTIIVEWRAGGLDGSTVTSERVGRYLLDGYRGVDGTYEIPAASVGVTATAACTLPAGTYTLVVLDTAIDEVVAAGPVTIAP